MQESAVDRFCCKRRLKAFSVSDSVPLGECGLEFTIPYRNRTIKGSIAWTDVGLRLRLPESGFVVVDGKLSESQAEIFNAMVALKGLAVGFYDGTILPIAI